MATLGLVLQAMQGAVQTLLAQANLAQRVLVIIGQPTATEWAESAAQSAGGVLVAILPLPGARYDDPNPLNYQNLQAPSAGTTATISEGVLTIGGAPKAGDSVHGFFNGALGDAYCGVLAGDTPSTIATKIAASANAAGFPGISAAASGANVTLSGSYFSAANVGGSGSVAIEVARAFRIVQLTVFAATSEDREAVGEELIANIGSANSQWLTTADGDSAFVTLDHDRWSDEASDSYTTFRWDLLFRVVHSVMQTVQIAQLEAVENIVAQNAPATIYAG